MTLEQPLHGVKIVNIFPPYAAPADWIAALVAEHCDDARAKERRSTGNQHSARVRRRQVTARRWFGHGLP
jgi:hypothetical protein